MKCDVYDYKKGESLGVFEFDTLPSIAEGHSIWLYTPKKKKQQIYSISSINFICNQDTQNADIAIFVEKI